MYQFDHENHVHYLDEKPLIGTSTACHVIAKPLTWWASGMAVATLGWMNSKKKINGKIKFFSKKLRLERVAPYLERIKELTAEQFLDLLDTAYKAHNQVKEDAAVTGTDRHAILEKYVKECIEKNGGVPMSLVPGQFEEIQEFVDWAHDNIKKFLWSEIYGYSREMWTGGIADVGWIDMKDKIVAGDFKSSKEAYFDQYIQIGGYDLMLTENGGFDDSGNKIFELSGLIERYCVIPFGQEILNPQFIEDVQAYKMAFKSAVHLYKLQQEYGRTE